MGALSYAHGASEVPLRGETIGELWRATVRAHGGRPALVSRHQGIRWTYDELHEQVERCARALIASGVERGDRVGLWAPNCAEWLVVQFGTALAGAILVNLNPSYRSHELSYALRQSGCSLLVLAEGFRDVDYVATVDALELDGLRERVVLGTGFETFLERCSGVDAAALATREAELAFDDAINVQYTSGTTGLPKGATLSHHNVVNNGFFIGEVLGYDEHDSVCLPVPYYHCFGMVLGTFAIVSHGACSVLPGASFAARDVLEAVAAERCTALYGVPTMFVAELADPQLESLDLTSLRTGIMAGSPCPVEVMRRVRAELCMDEVTICYGMTETSPVSTQTARDDPVEKRVATVGRVHPHVEVKVVDPVSGRIVPRGVPGELCTRGYSVMLGYWEDEAATSAAIDAARWMHTGDLATMDDDGYVAIVGRIKDMVIRGGENVYPREIEELLYTHPQIADAQVVGVPDDYYGEELCAWIVLRAGAELGEDELREWCRERVARFKVPRYVRFVDGFPLTVTGKVQKFKIREAMIEELGLAAPAAAAAQP
jgi:fatty-acyl-CoA synthase